MARGVDIWAAEIVLNLRKKNKDLHSNRVANARRVDKQVYNQPPQKTQADNTTDMNPTELLGQIFSNSEMGKAFQAFLQQYQSNS